MDRDQGDHMDREELERQEIEERRARKKEAREAQMKKKKQEEQMMIGGGIILLAVLILVIVLVARGCRNRKDPENPADQSSTETVERNSGSETKGSEQEETQPVATDTQAPESQSEDETAPSENTDASETPAPSSEPPTTQASDYPATNWDLASLDNTPVYFGYAVENRDPVTHIPTDWAWYESKWGQYNVDWIQDTSQNIIYLTMDEGYPNEYTSTILDILAEKNVKACFFITQMFLDGGEQSAQQIQRMINEGHVIGNHSVRHKNMPSLSIEEQTSEIVTVNQHLKEQFGIDCRLFRFPEGVYSDQCLALVDNLGMKTCFWSYAYNDYSEEQPPVEESLQKAIDALHPGAIYLLHANSATNTAFLSRWIDAARAQGFEFGVYPLTAN